jgi:nucleoside-diphosphate-sugar epimerase
LCDLDRPEPELRAALADATHVVSLAHARFIPAVLAALPEGCARVIVTGSTRKFTRLPDPAADAVRAGEAAFLAFQARAAGEAVLLHPSMIYGTPEDRSVNRLMRWYRRWPRLLPVPTPLPDGGRHLVQPVHVDDVVAAFVAALSAPGAPGEPIILAGPEPISYRAFTRACAAAVGRRAWVLPVPVAPAAAVLDGFAALRLRLPFSGAALRRTAEDNRFDVTPLRARLGVEPRPFAPAWLGDAG